MNPVEKAFSMVWGRSCEGAALFILKLHALKRRVFISRRSGKTQAYAPDKKQIFSNPSSRAALRPSVHGAQTADEREKILLLRVGRINRVRRGVVRKIQAVRVFPMRQHGGQVQHGQIAAKIDG